jgi:glycosyltransferase involved in cell wall biosynthesis
MDTNTRISDAPKVSVIMNCYNCSKYMREAIDSVYSQTYKDWEIIFWDNASTDNSGKIARSYNDRLRYFRGENLVTLGHARNLAIEKARGKYIAFLDCDDIWLPEKLKKQIGLMESNEGIDLTYTDCFLIDGEGNFLKHIFSEIQKFYRGYIFGRLLYNDFIIFSTVVLRRAMLENTGLFNPNYKIVEDYDLLLRVAETHKIDFINQSLVKYRYHNSNLSNNLEQLAQEEYHLIDSWTNKKTNFRYNVKKLINRKKLFLNLRLLKFYFLKLDYINVYKVSLNIPKFLYLYLKLRKFRE